MISFYIFSKTFFPKRKELSNASVVSNSKKKYGIQYIFSKDSILKSISDE